MWPQALAALLSRRSVRERQPRRKVSCTRSSAVCGLLTKAHRVPEQFRRKRVDQGVEFGAYLSHHQWTGFQRPLLRGRTSGRANKKVRRCGPSGATRTAVSGFDIGRPWRLQDSQFGHAAGARNVGSVHHKRSSSIDLAAGERVVADLEGDALTQSASIAACICGSALAFLKPFTRPRASGNRTIDTPFPPITTRRSRLSLADRIDVILDVAQCAGLLLLGRPVDVVYDFCFAPSVAAVQGPVIRPTKPAKTIVSSACSFSLSTALLCGSSLRGPTKWG